MSHVSNSCSTVTLIIYFYPYNGKYWLDYSGFTTKWIKMCCNSRCLTPINMILITWMSWSPWRPGCIPIWGWPIHSFGYHGIDLLPRLEKVIQCNSHQSFTSHIMTNPVRQSYLSGEMLHAWWEWQNKEIFFHENSLYH